MQNLHNWLIKNKPLFSSLLILTATLQSLNATIPDPAKFFFSQINKEDGLVHSSIKFIYQDTKGFIWIGTGGGLCRYDGYGFKNYQPDFSTTNSIASSSVNGILEDTLYGESVLYLTTGNGFNVFYVERDSFATYMHTEGDPNSILNDQTKEVIKFEPGSIWISCEKGISNFNPTTKHFTNYNITELDFIESRTNVSTLIKDPVENWLWIGTTGHLLHFDLDTKTFHNYIVDKQSSHNHSFIFADQSNNIYTVYSHGFLKFKRENGEFITIPFPVETGRITSDVQQMYQDKSGNIYVSTYHGLWMYEPGLKNVRTIESDPNNPNSLSNNLLRCVYIDDTDVMWIGTYKGGLNKTDLHRKGFYNFTGTDWGFEYEGKFNVFAIEKDHEGRIWFGTNNGVYVYCPASNKYHFFTHSKDIPHSLTNQNIAALKVDKTNTLWIACMGWGLNALDLNAIQFENFKQTDITDKLAFKKFIEDIENPHTIRGWSHRSVLEDREGNIWITSRDGGISMYSHSTGYFTNYLPDNSNPNSIPDRAVWTIYQAPSDSNHLFWLGTFSSGLVRFNKKTERFWKVPLIIPGDSVDHISSVRTIFEDEDSILWVGTNNGLYKYIHKTAKMPEVVRYGIEDGLPNQLIYGIEPDKNTLWISTEDGLVHFMKDSENFITYDKTDGIAGDEFSYGAYFRDDSTIFFGSSEGATWFKPDEIIDNPFPPKVVLTNLQIGNNTVDVGEKFNDKVILDKLITYKDKIVLTYHEKIVTFEFAALHYAFPERNRYRYKMEGFEDTWNEVGSERRFATYTNLPAGKYNFQVVASNNDDLWSTDGVNLTLIVLPPWWKTWWFRIIALISIVGSVISYYKYKTYEIKQRAKILEKQVAERTAELSNANAELEEQKEEIRQNMEEIEAQRDQLQVQSKELKQKNKEVSKAYENIKVISEFGQRVTSTLSMDNINHMIYEYVSSLMDTSAFGIGIHNKERKIIEFYHFVENGEVLPYFYKELSSENSLSVRCLKNKEEIVINDLSEEYKKYLGTLPEVQTKQMPRSMIHIPLIIEERAIGTITINSFNKNAYSENDLTNLRSLASYISIALDNANVYKVVNEQNEHIKAGIDYAKTIQQAILPIRENMDLYFKSFILFRPKDVVSGDFYYFTPVSNGACIVAVIDCTGHGVPGAFMSMIGNRLLNDIINGRGIESPAEILEELDKGVQKALKQDQTANNDGMDVCIVRVSAKSESEDKPDSVEDLSAFNNKIQITFSGAMRPLYYIEADSTEVKKLNGDRRSIGGTRTKRKESIRFTDQVLSLEQGSHLYLFSDGYTDQNNTNRDKIGVLKLTEILQSNVQKPLNEQYNALCEELDRHQGIEDQLDDITLLGVKL